MKVHFHSSLPADQAKGWNFRSTRPQLILCCDSQTKLTTLTAGSKIEQTWTDPLAALQWMTTQSLPTSTARWLGYLSYDVGRLFESIATIATDDLCLPLFCFALMEEKMVPDPVFSHPGGSEKKTGSGTISGFQIDALRSTLPRPMYLQHVGRAIEYIAAGDIFQVNLSQRFTVPLTISPGQVWQNLLSRTSAAYGALIDLGDHAIVCNSPELFLHVTPDRRIITRPIKGTRPVKPGMYEQLLHSQKDQAELNMIVDLERNDLGRICELGSVRVTQPRSIETHPTVHHGVATIEGKLKPDVNFVDLLRATFPGGSITGAPKIRAMQIIETLEPVRRGPYCGAIGFIAGDGSMQFNIAIRTIVIKDNQAHIAVGGGIVADSVPLEEYEETLTKAAALFSALNMAG
jgi:para-aminobenzoate synthetase component 1